jgi:hypothetical protein
MANKEFSLPLFSGGHGKVRLLRKFEDHVIEDLSYMAIVKDEPYK